MSDRKIIVTTVFIAGIMLGAFTVQWAWRHAYRALHRVKPDPVQELLARPTEVPI
jgi:hypothetical protein